MKPVRNSVSQDPILGLVEREILAAHSLREARVRLESQCAVPPESRRAQCRDRPVYGAPRGRRLPACDPNVYEDRILPYPNPLEYSFEPGHPLNPDLAVPVAAVFHYPASPPPHGGYPIALVGHGATAGVPNDTAYRDFYGYLVRCLAANGFIAGSIRTLATNTEGRYQALNRKTYYLRNMDALRSELDALGLSYSPRTVFIGHSEAGEAVLAFGIEELEEYGIDLRARVAFAPTSGSGGANSMNDLLMWGTLDDDNAVTDIIDHIYREPQQLGCVVWVPGGWHGGFAENVNVSSTDPGTAFEIVEQGLTPGEQQQLVAWYTLAFARWSTFGESYLRPYLFGEVEPDVSARGVVFFRTNSNWGLPAEHFCTGLCHSFEGFSSYSPPGPPGMLSGLDPLCPHLDLGWRGLWIEGSPRLTFITKNLTLGPEVGLKFGIATVVESPWIQSQQPVTVSFRLVYDDDDTSPWIDRVLEPSSRVETPSDGPIPSRSRTLLRTFYFPASTFIGGDSREVAAIEIELSADGGGDVVFQMPCLFLQYLY